MKTDGGTNENDSCTLLLVRQNEGDQRYNANVYLEESHKVYLSGLKKNRESIHRLLSISKQLAHKLFHVVFSQSTLLVPLSCLFQFGKDVVVTGNLARCRVHVEEGTGHT